MKNQIIKQALFTHNLKQWQLAEIMGIREEMLSRKLRHELPEDEQRDIVRKIEEAMKK